MILITSEHFATPNTNASNRPEMTDYSAYESTVYCTEVLKSCVIHHCPDLQWRWIMLAAGNSDLLNDKCPPNLVLAGPDQQPSSDIRSLHSLNLSTDIITETLSSVLPSTDISDQALYIVLLESIGSTLSSHLVSDVRDVLVTRVSRYFLATAVWCLLSQEKDTDESDSLSPYGLRGDAFLILKHISVLLVTHRELDQVVFSAADEDVDVLPSKLRLCLGLIKPGPSSCVLYVANDTVAACFAEPDVDTASVVTVPRRASEEALQHLQPLGVLLQVCARLESGASPQDAVADIGAPPQ